MLFFQVSKFEISVIWDSNTCSILFWEKYEGTSFPNKAFFCFRKQKQEHFVYNSAYLLLHKLEKKRETSLDILKSYEGMTHFSFLKRVTALCLPHWIQFWPTGDAYMLSNHTNVIKSRCFSTVKLVVFILSMSQELPNEKIIISNLKYVTY